MLWTAEALGPSIANRLSQWERGLWSRQQFLDGLLTPLAFTLCGRPEARNAVLAAIKTLQPSIASELVGWLDKKRTPSGWEWPPSGAIGIGGERTVFGPAEPAEVAVYEMLDEWLRVRAACASLPDTEQMVPMHAAPPSHPTGWAVWRIDDNANTYLVRAGLGREEAERLAAEFTARGHKQMYWVEPEAVAPPSAAHSQARDAGS